MHENINRKSRRDCVGEQQFLISARSLLPASRNENEFVLWDISSFNTQQLSRSNPAHKLIYSRSAGSFKFTFELLAAAAAHMNVIEISNVHRALLFFFVCPKERRSLEPGLLFVTQIWTIFFCVCKRAPLFLLFHVKIAKSQQQQYNVFVCRSW